MGHYAFEEVEEAFKLYVGGEFEISVMQQLNAVVVGRVMREFEKHKKDKLQEYRKRKARERNEVYEPTKSEKERMMLEGWGNALQELELTGKFEFSKWHLYDWAIESGRKTTP